MRHLAIALLLTATLAQPLVTRATESSSESKLPQLTNAETSVDRLVERFRRALVEKDKQALRALRVTRDEYVDIIMPGSVEPGKANQGGEYSQQAKDYFWGVLNGRSIYVEANLLHEYGGHPFKVKDVKYRKGLQQYATYKAYKQLELTLEDEEGKVDRLQIGSVAEIDGRFKFISYVRD